MDNFLDGRDPQKLNQDEVNNFTRSITTNEIQALIKNLSTKNIQNPFGFSTEFY